MGNQKAKQKKGEDEQEIPKNPLQKGRAVFLKDNSGAFTVCVQCVFATSRRKTGGSSPNKIPRSVSKSA